MHQNKPNFIKSTNWKKASIWIAAIIGFILILLIVGSFILQNKLPEQLKAQINKGSKGVYQLSFDDMEVSLIAGSIKLTNIHLIPDTAAYYQNLNAESSSNIFRIQSPSLNISGLKFLKLYFNKKVQASALTLNKPDILVMKMQNNVDVDSNEHKTLYQQMPEFLKNAKLELLRVNDLSYTQQEKGDTLKRGGKLTGITFALESITIDSVSSLDSSVFWFCKDIKLDSRNVNFATADGMYKFTIGKVKASAKGKSLDISDFKVTPLYPEIEFSKRVGTQGDRYHIVLQELAVRNINLKQLEKEGRLSAASLSLENAELRIFNNKTLPESGVVKAKNFPNIAMKRLKIPLTLDTLFMKDFAIYYKELSPKSEKAGTAFFTNLYGTLHNVTNDALQWKKDPWCRSSFQANFLGKAKLLVDLNLNMEDKDGAFNYKGSLGKANGKLFNQILEPLSLARIDDGTINKITFSINANRYGSSGHVQALYDNLTVSLLSKDGKVLKKKGFLSFLANSFIVKNSNPRKEGEIPISADISHLHPQDRSFFNLMWKGIFDGIKVNLGVPEL